MSKMTDHPKIVLTRKSINGKLETYEMIDISNLFIPPELM